jgi:hypothetical protein
MQIVGVFINDTFAARASAGGATAPPAGAKGLSLGGSMVSLLWTYMCACVFGLCR